MQKQTFPNHIANGGMLNHFSTPATNQPPPAHHILQATLIPTISEDKQFFRQRVNPNQNPPVPNPQMQLQTPINQQIPLQMQLHMHQHQQQTQNYTANDNDQTIQTMGQCNEDEDGEPHNFLLQHHHHQQQQQPPQPQQHMFLAPPPPHKKLNTMEIFAFGGEASSTATSSSASSSSSSATNLVAHQQPAPQRLIPHQNDLHGHLATDPDLSLNETDNEDDRSPRDHAQSGPAASNKLIIVELGEASSSNQVGRNQLNQEVSMVDLNELDEAQLKQLQLEEAKQQQEYFNVDHLNRYDC